MSGDDGKFPDLSDWVSALPPLSQWKGDAMSITCCSCSTLSLLFYANKKATPLHTKQQEDLVVFSLLADVRFPIRLWVSEACKMQRFHDTLFFNFIHAILSYAPQKSLPTIQRRMESFSVVMGSKEWKGMFNCAFLCMALCVCFYEAPTDIRSFCLNALEDALENVVKRQQSFKFLLQNLGSNIEENVMRSMGLLITNRIFKAMTSPRSFVWEDSNRNVVLFPYEYSSSSNGLWKVRVYAPVLTMKAVDKHSNPKDDTLLKALSYLQMEAVVQLCYELFFTPDWIEVRVKVDNIRCDVVPLASEEEIVESGEEKHFPSRLRIEVAPHHEWETLAVSVAKSSANPSYEMTNERSVETGVELPGTYGVLHFQSTEGSTMNFTPWKLEQDVQGSEGVMDWVLYDPVTGKEVWSSRPSKGEWVQRRAWFKDRDRKSVV